MKLKRRQFLFLAGVSAVSSGLIGLKWLRRKNRIIAKEEAIAETLAGKELLFRFISVGDTGTGGDNEYAVAKSMENYLQKFPYSLVLLAGDNIYTDGDIRKIDRVFKDVYQPLLDKDVKFYACLGNHDIRTHEGLDELDYPTFNMQGRYYTFTKANLQFFALDTNQIEDWQTQLDWLEKELTASQATWKIVFAHHPVYSSGRHGSNENLIKTLTPLFQKYNVQLYVNGHDHNYERTKSINGTTYVTCGAGAEIRHVGHSDWTKYSTNKLSFAAYDVYLDYLKISGIDTEGTVFDEGLLLAKSPTAR
jgi:3',5'-cyclic AMP phosphodiesterase CpdA